MTGLAFAREADQQKKRSGSYQKGKQNTDDDRNNPMSTIRRLDPFRSSAFLRRADAQQEKRVAHRPISRFFDKARRAIIGAAL